MIGQLTGLLLQKQPPQLLLDVQGVGYEVLAPMSTFYLLPDLGERVCLHTHLVVREDAHILYGFKTTTEKQLFQGLIKINSVGPKVALTLLSGMEIADFLTCVREENASKLTAIPGIGAKTAKRLVVEAKDLLKAPWATLAPGKEATTTTAASSSVIDDSIHALVALGYSAQIAETLVHKVHAQASQHYQTPEALIRVCLQQL